MTTASAPETTAPAALSPGDLIFVYNGPGLVTRLEGWALSVVEIAFGDGPDATRERSVAVSRNEDGELDIAAGVVPLSTAEAAWHLVSPEGQIVHGGPRGKHGIKPSLLRSELEEDRDSGRFGFLAGSVAVEGLPDTVRHSPTAREPGPVADDDGGFTAASGYMYVWYTPTL
jgi:hypothetical protein